MKRLFSVLALSAALMCTAPARAQAPEHWLTYAPDNKLYQSLKSMQETEPASKLIAHISVLVKSYQKLWDLYALIAFLSENSYGMSSAQDKLNIDFFLLYSDAYFLLAHTTRLPAEQVSYLRQALRGAMLFEALSMADGARCTDETAWPAYKSQILSKRLGRLSIAYAAFKPDEYLRTIEDTLAGEEKLVGRPPNTSICAMGAAPATPAFADPYAWSNKRMTARGTVVKFWKQRYEKATKFSFGDE